MPRLLPLDALEPRPPTLRRLMVTALVLLTLPATANITQNALPTEPVQQTERIEWETETIGADGAAQLTGSLDGFPVTVTATWDPGLRLTAVRLEHYTDEHGTGLRLGATAFTHTRSGDGEQCLHLTATGPTDIGDTQLDTCARTDGQTQDDTHPHRDKEPADHWLPEHLYTTQTATVATEASAPTLIDHFAIGANAGDSYDTGLWGPHWWEPMDYGPHNESWQWSCDQAEATEALENDPRYGEKRNPPITDTPPLLIPRCVPIEHRGSQNPQSHYWFWTAPFTTDTAAPLSAWVRYNDATALPQPLRLSVLADLRTCDTEPEHCHTDAGLDWMTDLLGIDCLHAIGGPCPGLGPDS
ncbi:hypothetical protein [Glycomyces tarimensis]